MMNMKLINTAVNLVSECFEMENIAIADECIRKRVEEWYNHTDITDAYELATAAWLGDYNVNITYDSIRESVSFLFPKEVVDQYDIHIGEIEEALNDANWQ